MIESLHISNYALIDNVDIEFANGLNIITGETGAGKSIMLGALSMLLGGRADTKVVTDPSRKSTIEAVMHVQDNINLKEWCKTNGVEWNDDDRIILRREVSPTGRSRAFVNDMPVNLTTLGEVSRQLVDIHSQHQNLLLATPEFQLEIIDSMTDNRSELKEYGTAYDKYRTALKAYAVAKRLTAKGRDDEEEMRSQLEKIDILRLTDGEQEELERERDTLENISRLKESLAAIADALGNESDGACETLRRAYDEADSLTDYLTESEDLSERLESCRLEVEDIRQTFESIDDSLSPDPRRLVAVEERLDAIYELERHHRVDTVKQLIDIAENLRTTLSTLDNSDFRLKELEEAARGARKEALRLARSISEKRKAQCEAFAVTLRETAMPLGMKNLVVEMALTHTNDLTPTGIDNVEMRVAFNKNQEPMTVSATASGGEISRLMLSVKSIIASKMELPTIIFDEIDTGVSGEIADRMGLMMLEIAGNMQVVAITHLPQVAAKGQAHFKVYKEDDESSTHTRMRRLDDTAREHEIAVMLSGATVNDAALANARSLLKH
ncbi:MAG: DNA repair protein RecN [Muribaculaceae bacterium]|jgi:DNA repair protein RecN|nr:DNA repair protein RecN [Muribaculaceae bacterium]